MTMKLVFVNWRQKHTNLYKLNFTNLEKKEMRVSQHGFKEMKRNEIEWKK